MTTTNTENINNNNNQHAAIVVDVSSVRTAEADRRSSSNLLRQGDQQHQQQQQQQEDSYCSFAWLYNLVFGDALLPDDEHTDDDFASLARKYSIFVISLVILPFSLFGPTYFASELSSTSSIGDDQTIKRNALLIAVISMSVLAFLVHLPSFLYVRLTKEAPVWLLLFSSWMTIFCTVSLGYYLDFYETKLMYILVAVLAHFSSLPTRWFMAAVAVCVLIVEQVQFSFFLDRSLLKSSTPFTVADHPGVRFVFSLQSIILLLLIPFISAVLMKIQNDETTTKSDEDGSKLGRRNNNKHSKNLDNHSADASSSAIERSTAAILSLKRCTDLTKEVQYHLDSYDVDAASCAIRKALDTIAEERHNSAHHHHQDIDKVTRDLIGALEQINIKVERTKPHLPTFLIPAPKYNAKAQEHLEYFEMLMESMSEDDRREGIVSVTGSQATPRSGSLVAGGDNHFVSSDSIGNLAGVGGGLQLRRSWEASNDEADKHRRSSSKSGSESSEGEGFSLFSHAKKRKKVKKLAAAAQQRKKLAAAQQKKEEDQEQHPVMITNDTPGATLNSNTNKDVGVVIDKPSSDEAGKTSRTVTNTAVSQTSSKRYHRHHGRGGGGGHQKSNTNINKLASKNLSLNAFGSSVVPSSVVGNRHGSSNNNISSTAVPRYLMGNVTQKVLLARVSLKNLPELAFGFSKCSYSSSSPLSFSLEETSRRVNRVIGVILDDAVAFQATVHSVLADCMVISMNATEKGIQNVESKACRFFISAETSIRKEIALQFKGDVISISNSNNSQQQHNKKRGSGQLLLRNQSKTSFKNLLPSDQPQHNSGVIQQQNLRSATRSTQHVENDNGDNDNDLQHYNEEAALSNSIRRTMVNNNNNNNNNKNDAEQHQLQLQPHQVAAVPDIDDFGFYNNNASPSGDMNMLERQPSLPELGLTQRPSVASTCAPPPVQRDTTSPMIVNDERDTRALEQRQHSPPPASPNKTPNQTNQQDVVFMTSVSSQHSDRGRPNSHQQSNQSEQSSSSATSLGNRNALFPVNNNNNSNNNNNNNCDDNNNSIDNRALSSSSSSIICGGVALGAAFCQVAGSSRRQQFFICGFSESDLLSQCSEIGEKNRILVVSQSIYQIAKTEYHFRGAGVASAPCVKLMQQQNQQPQPKTSNVKLSTSKISLSREASLHQHQVDAIAERSGDALGATISNNNNNFVPIFELVCRRKLSENDDEWLYYAGAENKINNNNTNIKTDNNNNNNTMPKLSPPSKTASPKLEERLVEVPGLFLNDVVQAICKGHLGQAQEILEQQKKEDPQINLSLPAVSRLEEFINQHH